MSLSDPIADMLTRIRNAVRINKKQVNTKASNICEGIAYVLKKEGYIDDYDRIDDGRQGILMITLKLELELFEFILISACLNCFIDNLNIGTYLLFINLLIIFYLLLVKIKTTKYLKFTLKKHT